MKDDLQHQQERLIKRAEQLIDQEEQLVKQLLLAGAESADE